jgi:hypothetical protein
MELGGLFLGNAKLSSVIPTVIYCWHVCALYVTGQESSPLRCCGRLVINAVATSWGIMAQRLAAGDPTTNGTLIRAAADKPQFKGRQPVRLKDGETDDRETNHFNDAPGGDETASK